MLRREDVVHAEYIIHGFYGTLMPSAFNMSLYHRPLHYARIERLSTLFTPRADVIAPTCFMLGRKDGVFAVIRPVNAQSTSAQAMSAAAQIKFPAYIQVSVLPFLKESYIPGKLPWIWIDYQKT